MENKMTVFYSKSSGKITSITSGVTDMGYYGDDEQDFSQIYTFLITELDEYVIDNYTSFEIVDKELKFMQPYIPNKYL